MLGTPHAREGFGLLRIAVLRVSSVRAIEPVTKRFCVVLADPQLRRRANITSGGQSPEHLRIQWRRLSRIEIATKDGGIWWGNDEQRSAPLWHVSAYADG
jgi:hypothetical protein